MLRNNYIIIFVLLFSSCITQKKCEERFPSKETDSVKTTVSFVHDTVYEYFESEDTGFEEDVLDIDTTIEYHREEKIGKQTAILDIHKGKIKVTCREDAYKDTIAFLRKQIEIKEKKTVILPPVIRYVDHWYHKPLLYYFWITLLLGIGFAAGKWFKLF